MMEDEETTCCIWPRKFRPYLLLLFACSLIGLMIFGTRVSRGVNLANIETRCIIEQASVIYEPEGYCYITNWSVHEVTRNTRGQIVNRCVGAKSLAMDLVARYMIGTLHICLYDNTTDTGLAWPNDPLVDVPTPLYLTCVTMGLVLSAYGAAMYFGLILYDLVMYARRDESVVNE